MSDKPKLMIVDDTTPISELEKPSIDKLNKAKDDFENEYVRFNQDHLAGYDTRTLLQKREQYFMSAEIHAANSALCLKHAMMITSVLNQRDKEGNNVPNITKLTDE